jgi:hypothetical protein
MLTLKKKPAQKDPPRPQAKTPVSEQAVATDAGHEDEIRPLAYRKWQEAGSPPSDGTEFWLAAETEILRRSRR